MKQKDAVYQAVTETMGNVDGAYKPTKEQRLEMITLLATGINNGEIDYTLDRADMVSVRTYSSGLLSNWLKKDTRLNGGAKYEAKNPGSRKGGTDPMIRELRKVKAQYTKLGETDKVTIVEQAISKRLAEITIVKVSEPDVSKLPEDIQILLSQLDSEK